MEAQKAPMHAVVDEVLDQLRGAWRFKKVAMLTAWCVALVLWTALFLIPTKYQATARVFVDTGTTLTKATQGIALSDNAENQIERVRDAILGIPELQRVANATNLMAGAITAQQRQNVIETMRQNLSIEGQLSSRDGSAALFTINYKDVNRDRAVQVVDKLLNTFVEGTLFDNHQGSQQALQFLQQQITEYGAKLTGIEQQLAAFKRRNIGLLPNEQGDYFARLQSDDRQLTQLKENLYVAERERDAIAAEMRSGQQFTAAPSTVPMGSAALDTEQQIQQDQQRLDQMLLKYTDRYPDVIALRATISALKVREQQQMKAAQKGDVGAASALGLAANPVFQRLQEQFNAQQVQIASIRQQIADREQSVAKLRSEVRSAPEVQAEFARLTRNYTVTKTQYNALLARLDSTRLSQQAASTGTVKFQVIDPPTAPFKPVSPHRPLLIIGVLILALGVGLGTGYLLNQLKPVFVSDRQLGVVTGLTVLGSVSMAGAQKRLSQRRRDLLIYSCATVGLVLLGVTVLVLNIHIAHWIGELRT